MTSVVLLGPPGVGKGTQADALRRRYGFAVVASGVLLRRHVAQATEIGVVAEGYMTRGALVPDELVTEIVTVEIARYPSRPVVIEGFPKTAPQARTLDAALRGLGRCPDAVIAFSAPTAVLRSRLSHRAAEESRVDDSPETAAARLRAHGVTPDDLLDHYRRQGVLHEVDADRPLPAVTTDVIRTVERLLGDGATSRGSME